MRQSQGESIWGNINLSIEIALNVYQIYADNGKGIMVKANDKHNLSESTLEKGVKDSEGNVYFDEETQKYPMLEILQNREIQTKAALAAIEQQRQELLNGKSITDFDLNDFIGKHDPPENVKEEVRNGIYFTLDNDEVGFAVHEAVVSNTMSTFATDFAIKDGEYFHFDMAHSAIPIVELKETFPEVEALVISEDSLYATLNENFPYYVKQYNEACTEERQMPNVTSATNLFLAMQLKGEREQPNVGADELDYAHDDYGEEVDFAFEQ